MQITHKDFSGRFAKSCQRNKYKSLPMMEIGLRANLMRPPTPMYLLRQPDDHSRMEYSRPKNNTRTIS